jgi:hypothetical protein
MIDMTPKKDVFLCHTSEDKKRYVTPFVKGLQEEGITYWVNEAEIKWGDDIVKRINEGLEISRFVVVFLSQNFIGRHWAEEELASALSKENASGVVIVLPILIEDETVIFKQYPLLRQKRYVKWSDDVSSIMSKLKSLLGHIDDSGDDFKKNGDEDLSVVHLSKRELLGELQSYSALIPSLKTKTHQQQLNFSLHNQFSMLLMANYKIYIKDAERNNALKLLNDKLNTISTPGAPPEEEYFNKNFPKDIKDLRWSVSEVKTLVKDITELVEISNPSHESANKMVKLIEEFHTLCYGLFSMKQNKREKEIKELLAIGESNTVEFKKTLIWDVNQGKRNHELRKVIAKEIVAFMNTKGGTLLIGVDDDGNPVGLDYDFKLFDGEKSNVKEKFQRTFGQIIFDLIGPEYDQFIRDSDFITVDGTDMFFAIVGTSLEPAYLTYKKEKPIFYIRVRNASPPLLDVKMAMDYYKMRWR